MWYPTGQQIPVGINTTSAHAPGALFGVYGMLGIGLMLFVLRSLYRVQVSNNKLISVAFWSINWGLMLMLLLSLLPMGILQTVAGVNEEMSYARSVEFLHGQGMDTIRWLQVIGDTISAVGLFAFVWFVFSLDSKHKLPDDKETSKRVIKKTRILGPGKLF